MIINIAIQVVTTETIKSTDAAEDVAVASKLHSDKKLWRWVSVVGSKNQNQPLPNISVLTEKTVEIIEEIKSKESVILTEKISFKLNH